MRALVHEIAVETQAKLLTQLSAELKYPFRSDYTMKWIYKVK